MMSAQEWWRGVICEANSGMGRANVSVSFIWGSISYLLYLLYLPLTLIAVFWSGKLSAFLRGPAGEKGRP